MSTRARILEVLAKHPLGITKDDLRRELKLREKTVENALACLRIAGGSVVWRQFNNSRWWALAEHEGALAAVHAAALAETEERKRAHDRRRKHGYRAPVVRPVSVTVWQQAPSIWHVAERIGAQA
jgi:DNA-binding transcriptional ArsR family regulator